MGVDDVRAVVRTWNMSCKMDSRVADRIEIRLIGGRRRRRPATLGEDRGVMTRIGSGTHVVVIARGADDQTPAARGADVARDRGPEAGGGEAFPLGQRGGDGGGGCGGARRGEGRDGASAHRAGREGRARDRDG